MEIKINSDFLLCHIWKTIKMIQRINRCQWSSLNQVDILVMLYFLQGFIKIKPFFCYLQNIKQLKRGYRHTRTRICAFGFFAMAFERFEPAYKTYPLEKFWTAPMNSKHKLTIFKKSGICRYYNKICMPK